MTTEASKEFLQLLIDEHKTSYDEKSSGAMFMKKAFDHFLEMGLPDKKHPEYAYFPFGKLYEKKTFDETLKPYSKDQILEKVLPECLESYLVIRSGSIDFDMSNISAIKDEIIVEALEKTHSPYMPFVHAKLVREQKECTDPLSLFCQANLKGFLIIVPDNNKVKKSLQIIFLEEDNKHFPTVNGYVRLSKGAELDVTLTCVCEQKMQTASFIDIDVAEEAKLSLARAGSDSHAMMFDTLKIHLKKHSSAKVVDLQQPKAPSKFHLHVIHEQKESDSKFYSLGLIEKKKEYHVTTNFEHVAGEATSFQSIKTVLQTNAKVSFMGQIHVHKEALLTQSYQKHATLMLGKQGIVNSRPNLRIFADDVKASHGATIAEIDEASLFYLKTRGIDELEAKTLLLDAFCHEITNELSSEALKETALEHIRRVQDYDDKDASLL